VENNISSFMEYIWAPFLALFWYFVNRLTAKIDEIEKGKAGNASLGRVADQTRDLDKRLDEISHTTVPRPEYKMDISSLHNRINAVERLKQDKIKNVRILPKNENP